jgi:hypothetical protein
MAKFRKGDRVRATEDLYFDLPAGSMGTVVEDGSDTPFVEWDGFTGGHSGPFCDGRETCISAHEKTIEFVSRDGASCEARVLALLIAAGHVKQAQVDAAAALLEAR